MKTWHLEGTKECVCVTAGECAADSVLINSLGLVHHQPGLVCRNSSVYVRINILVHACVLVYICSCLYVGVRAEWRSDRL